MALILKDAIIKVTLTKEKLSGYLWDDGKAWSIFGFTIFPETPKYWHPKAFYSNIYPEDIKEAGYLEKEPTKGLWHKANAKIRLVDGSTSFIEFESNEDMENWALGKFNEYEFLNVE